VANRVIFLLTTALHGTLTLTTTTTSIHQVLDDGFDYHLSHVCPDMIFLNSLIHFLPCCILIAPSASNFKNRHLHSVGEYSSVSKTKSRYEMLCRQCFL